MTTTFRIRPDEINESFLAKLRGLFSREDEVEIVVRGSERKNGTPLATQNGRAASRYDEDYLNSKIALARKSWAGVSDTDAWLRNLRGYDND